MSEAEEIAGARACMDGFMEAFNREDLQALREKWVHYPHVRLHSGKGTIFQTAEEHRNNLVWQQRDADRGQSAGWARTAWDYVEPVDAGAGKVHFRVQFTRYRADGSAIGSYRSLYIVTFMNGRWGIQARSSWAE